MTKKDSALKKELNYLKKKEERILFTIRRFEVKHKHIWNTVRIIMFALFGLSIGYESIRNRNPLFISALITLIIASIISFIALHYERRRSLDKKDHITTTENLAIVALISLIISCFAIASVANASAFLIVFAITLLFGALGQSLH